MRTLLLVFTIFISVTTIAYAQNIEALIKYEPSDIVLYKKDLKDTQIGHGVIRLTFNNEEELNVIKSEIIFLVVVDSVEKCKVFEYKLNRKLSKLQAQKLEVLSSDLDSVFRNKKFMVVNTNYTVFIPKADFVFKFKLYPN